MDIWRESGRVLAVLMPAPQKCPDTPTQTHIRTPSYQLSRTVSHPYFLLSDYLRARFCGERCRGNSGTSSVSRHCSWPKAGVQDQKAGLLSQNAHPQTGRMGRRIKAIAASTTEQASTKLCSKNSPAQIASLPRVFVSACWAPCG